MTRRSGIPARTPRRAIVGAALMAACVLLLTACGESVGRGYLPKGVTDSSPRITSLWNYSWIAALAVGAVTWGLMFWCVVMYRRKKTDTGLPEQLRYNVPVEILYTVLPLFMIAVLFFYTERDQSELRDLKANPDLTVNLVGKQWSWDFNYSDAGTYESGTQAEMTGKPGVATTLPTLYLPVNKRVEFVLTARDVIHSFWVPQFLQKMDMIPGKVNRFQVTPTEIGVFDGKCAELCGAYHSAMLFNVAVVSQADFDKHLADLKAAGNVGQLPNSLNRERLEPQQEQYVPEPARGSN